MSDPTTTQPIAPESPSTIGAPNAPKESQRTNFPRQDYHFVGREKDLKELHDQLGANRQLAITQPRVPHKHGGVGKTSLAIAYGWSHETEYPGGLFFIDGGARFLLTELAKLAEALNVKEGINQLQTAKRVKKQLAEGKRSLLVVDGLDDEQKWDEAEEAGVIPRKGNCRILATTTLSYLADLEMFNTRCLKKEDGTALLSTYRPDAGEEKLRKLIPQIVESFDGLPLGLAMLGTYMHLKPNLTWTELGEKLPDLGLAPVTRKDKRRAISVPDYGAAIHKFFDELLDSLDLQHRIALEFSALLPERHVVSGWVCELLESKDVVEMAKMGDREPLSARQVLSNLYAWQLLRSQSADNRVLQLHPYLRRRLTQRCEEGKYLHKNTSRDIRELAKRRVKNCGENWRDKAVRIEFTALVELAKMLRDRGDLDTSAKTVRQVALLLHKLRRFHDVVGLIETFVTDDAIQALAPETACVLLSDHASGLSAIGEDKEAAEYMKKAIEMDKQHLEPNHPILAAHYSNYAGILKNLGKLDSARKCIKMAIKIEQKHYGKGNRRLGLRHWWLGDIELADGKIEDASAQYRRAHKILSKHFKPDHEHVVTLAKILKNLDGPSAEPTSPTTDA